MTVMAVVTAHFPISYMYIYIILYIRIIFQYKVKNEQPQQPLQPLTNVYAGEMVAVTLPA